MTGRSRCAAILAAVSLLVGASAIPAATRAAKAPEKIPNPSLEYAIKQAESNGVKVIKDPDRKYAAKTADEAKDLSYQIAADYASQSNEITKASNDALRISMENRDKKSKFDAENKVYNDKLDIYLKAKATYDSQMQHYYAVDATNQNKKNQYQSELDTYRSAKEEFDRLLPAYTTAYKTYQTDLANYNTQKSEYDKDKARYDREMEKFRQDQVTYNNKMDNLNVEGGSEWSKDQIRQFLMVRDRNVSIAQGSGGTEFTTDLRPTTQKELDAMRAELNKNDYGWMNYTTNDTFHMTVGGETLWKNVFKSAQGDMIDMKITVTKIDGFTIPGLAQNAFVQMRSNLRYATLGDDGGMAHFHVDFLKAGTNTPVELSAIIGFGDVDAGQSLLFPKYDARLLGRGLNEETDKYGNQVVTGKDAVDDTDQRNHAWFLVNGNGFDFGYNNPAKYKNVVGRQNQRYGGSWFQIGGIDLKVDFPVAPLAPNPVGVQPPVKPTLPTKPREPEFPKPPVITDNPMPIEPERPNAPDLPNYEKMPEVHYHDNYLAEPENGRIKIVKTLSDKPIAGAKYRITDQDGKTVDLVTTKSDGSIETRELALGKYTVQEVKAPAGYELDRQKYEVTIDGSENLITLNVYDLHKTEMPKTGSMILIALVSVITIVSGLLIFANKKR